jgi:hypothetical protein
LRPDTIRLKCTCAAGSKDHSKVLTLPVNPGMLLMLRPLTNECTLKRSCFSMTANASASRCNVSMGSSEKYDRSRRGQDRLEAGFERRVEGLF